MNEVLTKLFIIGLIDIVIGAFLIHFIRYSVRVASCTNLHACKFSEKDLEEIIDHPCLHEVIKDDDEEEEVKHVIDINERCEQIIN